MKQNRILLPFLAICLVACSKDDDEGHSKNEQNVPVKEITFKNCSFTMVKVDGGTDVISATMINSIYKIVSFIYELGEALGSYIRRSNEDKMCNL